MNKKALSPLAATAILVILSILIGTATMSFGKKYVEKTTVEKEETMAPYQSAIVINIDDVLGDDLKELQIRYITGKISKEEYLEREKELVE